MAGGSKHWTAAKLHSICYHCHRFNYHCPIHLWFQREKNYVRSGAEAHSTGHRRRRWVRRARWAGNRLCSCTRRYSNTRVSRSPVDKCRRESAPASRIEHLSVWNWQWIPRTQYRDNNCWLTLANGSIAAEESRWLTRSDGRSVDHVTRIAVVFDTLADAEVITHQSAISRLFWSATRFRTW